MAKKRISQEDIPDMIQQLLPVWQKEIDRLQALDEPTKQDLHLSLKLAAALNATHLQYRILKSEIRKETQALPLDKLTNTFLHAKN